MATGTGAARGREGGEAMVTQGQGQGREDQRATFGAWLDRAMDRIGMNAAALARQTGIDPSAISRYRRGLDLPRHDKAAALAAALGVEPATVWRAAGYTTTQDDSPISGRGSLRKRLTDAMMLAQLIVDQADDLEAWREFRERMVRVPVYVVATASEATAVLLGNRGEGQPDDELYLPADAMRGGERLVALRTEAGAAIEGASAGEEVVIGLGRAAAVGETVLAAVDGRLLLGRLVEVGDGLGLAPVGGERLVAVTAAVTILGPALFALRRL